MNIQYIFYSFFFSTSPAIFNPAFDPVLVKCVYKIFRVRNNLYFTWFFQHLQSCNRTHQFHPVVCCIDIALRKFYNALLPLAIFIQNDGAITACSRVSLRRTICIHIYLHPSHLPSPRFLIPTTMHSHIFLLCTASALW